MNNKNAYNMQVKMFNFIVCASLHLCHAREVVEAMMPSTFNSSAKMFTAIVS